LLMIAVSIYMPVILHGVGLVVSCAAISYGVKFYRVKMPLTASSAFIGLGVLGILINATL
ncbi:MAG: hypothetical protein PHG25_04330, partial [Candidatus Pacebacteria bacterium]|nr:hypothetical protein [Candidatus Paceibacterota bacterium]